MKLIPRVTFEPSLHRRRLVRRIVVEDEVNIEIGWHRLVDLLEESSELKASVALVAFPQDLPRRHVEGREERRRPVSKVVVGLAFWLTRSHRKKWLTAFERLDLGFLVHAQHDSVRGGIHVEPHNIADLVDEERIV